MLVNPQKLPLWVVGLFVAGIVGTVAFTVVIARLAWPLSLFGVLVVLSSTGVLVWSRVRAARHRVTAPSVEQPVVVVPETSADASWVSSGTFPGWFGPMDATAPLVVLELYEHVLRLRLQPRFIGVMFGAAPLVATPDGLVSVFPARRWTRRGVGFRTVSGVTYAFWSRRHQAILEALAYRGYPVSWSEQRVGYFS